MASDNRYGGVTQPAKGGKYGGVEQKGKAPTKKEKGKKNKGTTLKLNEFLAGTPIARTVQVSSSSWADEVEEELCMPSIQNIELPTAPRAARGVDIDMDRVPTRPPFTAYVGNLPFEVDDIEIENFFHGHEVVNVRIPDGRVKKFGYVEFADRNTLLEALALDGQKMRNNIIRVDLAEGQQNDRDRDNRRGGFGDRDREYIDDSRTEGDWRKKDPSDGPSRSSFGDRDRGGFGDRDRGGFGDRDRDRGGFGDRDRGGFGDRDRDRGGFGDRDRGGFGDRDRDRGSFGDRDRGSFGDRDRGSFGDRDRGSSYGDRDRGSGFGDRDRYGDRERSRGFGDWDRDRDRYGDRDGGRRSFGSGYSRDGDRGGGRYGDRYGGRDDRYGNRDRYDRMERRDEDRGPSRDTGASERPKLKLAPRTKPVEQAPASSSSIFGGAKPVDTAAREREIEDRLKRQRDMETEKLEQEKENRDTRYRLSSSTSERGRHSSQSDDAAPRRERKSSSSSGKGIRTVAPPPGAGSARIRRDSTLSEPEDVFDDDKPATKSSPKKEEALVPAPPPKENVWAKRMEPKSPDAKDGPPQRQDTPERENKEDAQKETPPKSVQSATAPKGNAWNKGRPEIIPAEPPKQNAWSKRSSQSDNERDNRDSKNNGEKAGDTGFSGSHWGGANRRRETGPPAAGRGDGGRGAGRGAKATREKRERQLPKSLDEMPQYSEKSDKDWSDANKFSTLMAEQEASELGNNSDQ